MVVEYLEQYHPSVADRFLEEVFAAFEKLAEMPGLGSPKQFGLPELSGIRSWAVASFRNYLVFYKTTDEAIIILAVVHGARNVRQLLRERLA